MAVMFLNEKMKGSKQTSILLLPREHQGPLLAPTLEQEGAPLPPAPREAAQGRVGGGLGCALLQGGACHLAWTELLPQITWLIINYLCLYESMCACVHKCLCKSLRAVILDYR